MNEDSNTHEADKKFSGDAWPPHTVKSAIEAIEQLVSEHGSQPLSREAIGKGWDLKPGTGAFNLKMSACNQYGLFQKEGKDNRASDLFLAYKEPIYSNDEVKFQIKMFLNAPLYAKIVSDHNNSILPPNEERLGNLIKKYNIHPNSALKAAKIFLENVRNLGLLDVNNKLKVDLSGNKQSEKDTSGKTSSENDTDTYKNDPPPPPLNPKLSDLEIKDYWKFTTRLKGGQVGYIFLPNDFDDDDLEKIVRLAKAQKDTTEEVQK